MSEKVECIICSNTNVVKTGDFEMYHFDCPNCGKMRMNDLTCINLPAKLLELKNEYKEILILCSHVIRKYYSSEHESILIDEDFINNIINNFKLPNLAEQSNNLIILLGDNRKQYSSILNVPVEYCKTMVGCSDEDDLIYIQKHLLESGFITIPEDRIELFDIQEASPEMGLTFQGWEKYNEFKTHDAESRYAFMAMDYKSKELNDICENHFKRAVDETGYELRLLRDRPKAGIIDNHLRISIRRAKFLIADLTHDNNGAYWEAGYAEGLGKHVIYLCEKTKFKEKKTHFDTNHCTTIPWDIDNIEEACEELKSTIRNTFFSEAQQDN